MPRDNIDPKVVPPRDTLTPGVMTKAAGAMTSNNPKKVVSRAPVDFKKPTGPSASSGISVIGKETKNALDSNPEERVELKKYGFNNDDSTEGKEVTQGKMSKGSQPLDKPVGSLVAKAAKSRAGISFKQNVRN